MSIFGLHAPLHTRGSMHNLFQNPPTDSDHAQPTEHQTRLEWCQLEESSPIFNSRLLVSVEATKRFAVPSVRLSRHQEQALPVSSPCNFLSLEQQLQHGDKNSI